MAAPNIVGVTSIFGVTNSYNLSTGTTVILSNASNSGKVFKVNVISAANISGSTASVTLRYQTAAGGGGSAIALANGIDVLTKSTLVLLDKASSIYLEENRSLVAFASAGSAIDLIISYEDITNL